MGVDSPEDSASAATGRRLYFVGQGSSSWRDPRNWSRSTDGEPLSHFHARGSDILVLGLVGGRDDVLDLRGMPHAGLEVSGYEGALRLPDGKRITFARSSRWQRIRRDRIQPHIPPGFSRAIRAAGGWKRSVVDGLATLHLTPRGWVVAPNASGGASRQLFWVLTAGGAWNATATGKWALTTGGASGQAIPTAVDDVHFDANSGTGTITWNAASVARSVDCTGFTGTVTINVATTTIGDPGGSTQASNIALKFVAGMTVTLSNAATSAISFVGTSATAQTITSAGKTLGNFTVNGAGGKVQFADAFAQGASATVTLTAGTLDTNGKACTWGAFSSSNLNVRTLTLGASAVSLAATGGVTVWNLTTATNLTVSGASATIQITSTDGSQKIFFGGGKTYGTLSMVMTGASNLSLWIADDGNQFATLDIESAGTGTGALLLGDNSTTSVTTSLTLAGNATHSLTVDNASSTNGTQATVKLGAGASTNTLSNITITGGSAHVLIQILIAPTIAGTSSLNPTVKQTRQLTPTLAGTSSLSVTPLEARLMSPAIQGSSSLALTLLREMLLPTALAGTSTLSVTPLEARLMSPGIQGSSSLALTLLREMLFAPALSGTSTLSVSPLEARLIPAAFSGAGTLTVSAAQLRYMTAALSGGSSLSAAVALSRYIAAAIAGVGGLDVALLPVGSLVSPLSGAGTLDVALAARVDVVTALQGTSTLAGLFMAVRYLPGAALVGSSALAFDVTTMPPVLVSLAGTSSLGATPRTLRSLAAAIAGAGSLDAALDGYTLMLATISGRSSLGLAYLARVIGGKPVAGFIAGGSLGTIRGELAGRIADDIAGVIADERAGVLAAPASGVIT